jgi:DNA-directed RNA polymerase subunit RPC12/RpoP
MELADQFKRVASVDVYCSRCSRAMALQRFHYVDVTIEFNAVEYKCLSCGHEETRPYPLVDQDHPEQ